MSLTLCGASIARIETSASGVPVPTFRKRLETLRKYRRRKMHREMKERISNDRRFDSALLANGRHVKRDAMGRINNLEGSGCWFLSLILFLFDLYPFYQTFKRVRAILSQGTKRADPRCAARHTIAVATTTQRVDQKKTRRKQTKFDNDRPAHWRPTQ